MSLNVFMAFVYLSIYLFIVILKSLSPQVLNEEYPVRLSHAHSVSYYTTSVKVLALIQSTKTLQMKTIKSKLSSLFLSRNWDGHTPPVSFSRLGSRVQVCGHGIVSHGAWLTHSHRYHIYDLNLISTMLSAI